MLTEGCAMHAMLGGELWLGAQATEARLKQLRGPRLLHLATHGFSRLEQAQCPASAGQSASMSAAVPQRGSKLPLQETKGRLWQDYPLLRSGLALAGANVCQSDEDNDGVLTALEVAALDLIGTQLVVLSACDTGVGAVQPSEGAQPGEGVYGLRRALVLAGAESQVMSLWKVDDAATQELMVAYYQRLLAGEGRAAALQQAQRTLRQTSAWSHPYFWASFIAGGEWQPLDKGSTTPP
jgi:CHAT domain-containing protein